MIRRDITWQITSKEDWRGFFSLVDAETEELVTLTGATMTLVASAAVPNGERGARLTGSTTSGHITLPTTTEAAFVFLVTEVATLPLGVYNVDLTISRDGQTLNVALGYLIIVEGYTP